MIRRLVVVLCVVLSGINVSSLASAAAGPRGSVVLKTSALKKVGSTQCGKVNGSWISGKVTKIKSKNYFVSYAKSSQLYSADANKSRGTKKKRLLNLSSDFKKKATTGNKKCFRYNASVPISTTVPVETTVPIATTTTTIAAPGPQPLKFDVSSAVALALADPSVSSAALRKRSVGSNLQIIDVDGKTKDAVISGQATIKNYIIAPNDKLYVEFSSSPLIDGSACLLAEVSRTSGNPECIEKGLDIRLIRSSYDDNRRLNSTFQFDDSGGVYYLALSLSWQRDFPGKRVERYHRYFPSPTLYEQGQPLLGSLVRRYKNGVTTDFTISRFEMGKKDEIGFGDSSNVVKIRNPIENFLVLKDGSILIDQMDDWVVTPTPPGQTGEWHSEPHHLDLWSPNGQRSLISGFTGVRGEAFGFMRIVDSNQAMVGTQQRMYRIDLFSKKFVEVPYLSELGTWNPRLALCVNEDTTFFKDFVQYVCKSGTYARKSWLTPNGSLFAIMGSEPLPYIEQLKSEAIYEQLINSGAKYGAGVLVRVWPDLEATTLGYSATAAELVRVESFLPILNSVVACGLDKSGLRRTVLYDTETKTTAELISPSQGIQINNFAFVARNNQLLFSGRRTSDDVPVIGTVNLITKVMSILRTGQTLIDMQSFSS